jgi:hypothetical protein
MMPDPYDPRPAKKLRNAHKHPDGHRLSVRQFAAFKRHAAHAALFDANATPISFHRRRARSRCA